MLSSFPNGRLHDCPTKIYKKKLVLSKIWPSDYFLLNILSKRKFVNSERPLSDCIRSKIHSKVVFVVTLGFTFHNLGTFLVLTNWRHCRGTKVQIFPGYKKHTFIFDCWWWRTVRCYQVCASFTWRLHREACSELKESFCLREDTREVTMIPKSWKILKT